MMTWSHSSLFKMLLMRREKFMLADLHTHTTASDGLNTPADNVRMAKESGLQAIAITDHDAVSGIEEAIEMAKQIGIEVIPGIEVSTIEKGQDIHILGYFIRYQDQEFLQKLDELQHVRARRNEMMIHALQNIGIDITLAEVKAKVRRKDANVGRPHIGEVLIEKGIVHTMEEGFDRYLGKNGKAYVNPKRISPEEGIDIIKKAGGVPVLAHPGIYHDDEVVVRLIGYGLAGLEAYHPDHDNESERKYKKLADEYGILATAGSDFHGSRNEVMFHAPIGGKTVSYEVVKQLKRLAFNMQTS